MYVRIDDGAVEGGLRLDGYVDARRFPPERVAAFIQEPRACWPSGAFACRLS